MNKYIKATVTAVMINQPETRDCDFKLMTVIYKGMCNGNDFFTMFEAKQLPSPETIRRTRAQLQEQHEYLRGQNYQSRQRYQVKVKKDLGYPQWLIKFVEEGEISQLSLNFQNFCPLGW